MRLSDKLKKVSDGRGLESAKHHVRRLLLTRRSAVPLEPAAIIKTIDPEKLAEINARHGVENPGEDPPKYLDLPRWIDANISRVRDLELDLGPRRRVLDLGSGTGYFLYICKLLGHSAIGLDLEFPLFDDMTELLGVKRVIGRIDAYKPLPDFGPAKFDVIAAHMICFNGHKSAQLWKIPEWEFFLNDASSRMNRDGKIWLEFNREFDGTCYTPELKKYFEARGAEVIGSRVGFNPIRPASR